MNILLVILIVAIVFVVAFFAIGTLFCSEFFKITKTDCCYTTEYIFGNGHFIKRITNTGLPIIVPIADWEKEIFEKGEYVKIIF